MRVTREATGETGDRKQRDLRCSIIFLNVKTRKKILHIGYSDCLTIYLQSMLNSTEIACSGLLFNIHAIFHLLPNTITGRKKSNRLLSKFKVLIQDEGKYNTRKFYFSSPT